MQALVANKTYVMTFTKAAMLNYVNSDFLLHFLSLYSDAQLYQPIVFLHWVDAIWLQHRLSLKPPKTVYVRISVSLCYLHWLFDIFSFHTKVRKVNTTPINNLLLRVVAIKLYDVKQTTLAFVGIVKFTAVADNNWHV